MTQTLSTYVCLVRTMPKNQATFLSIVTDNASHTHMSGPCGILADIYICLLLNKNDWLIVRNKVFFNMGKIHDPSVLSCCFSKFLVFLRPSYLPYRFEHFKKWPILRIESSVGLPCVTLSCIWFLTNVCMMPSVLWLWARILVTKVLCNKQNDEQSANVVVVG